jgi:hypothetical protein
MSITLEMARKEGVTLWDALEEFSDRALWNEYERGRNRFFPKLPPQDLPAEPIEWRITPPLQADPMKDYWAFEQLETRLKQNLLKLLTTGRLCATGYHLPRSRDRKPVWISSDRWEVGRVSWEKSEFWLTGEVFEDVLVTPSPAFRAATAVQAMPNPAPSRGPGRPTRNDEILPAYIALRDAGKIDFKSLNKNIATIRDTIVELSIDKTGTKGLGNDKIRTTIHDQFLIDKEAWVSSQKSSQKPSSKK